MKPAIECGALRFRYGWASAARHTVLHGIDLQIEPGEVVGLIGASGAGKSTLLALLAGRLTPTAGVVTVGGHLPASSAGARLVGLAPDPPVIPPECTGLEWLKYIAAHRALNPPTRLRLVRRAIETARLEPFVDRRVASYSRGMVQRLALGAALTSGSLVTLLDETLSGSDPLVARELRESLSEVAIGGRAIVVAGHDLVTIERLATRVIVLDRGRVVCDQDAAGLLRERTAELALAGNSLVRADWVIARFPGTVRTGEGVAVPLTNGLTVEGVLAACRSGRIAVAASRVRYRALEDLVAASVGARPH